MRHAPAHRRFWTILAASVLCASACKDREKAKNTSPDRADAATSTSATAPEQGSGIQPPVARYPRPLQLRRGLERVEPIGEVSLGGATDAAKESRELLAAGYVLCRDGWVFQGVYKGDKGHVATDPVVVLEAFPTQGKPHTYTNPYNTNLTTSYTFKVPPGDRLRGNIEVTEKGKEHARFIAKFDGPNSGLVASRGLGTLGCFTTGHYRITRDASFQVEGPVTAKRDAHDAYKIHTEISDKHAITIWLHLPPNAFRLGKVVDANLADILAKPKDFSARVFLDTRTDKGDGGLLMWEQTPIEQGHLSVELDNASPRSAAAKIKITGLTVSKEWKGLGEGGGESYDLELTTRFVIDRAGLLIPVAPKL